MPVMHAPLPDMPYAPASIEVGYGESCSKAAGIHRIVVKHACAVHLIWRRVGTLIRVAGGLMRSHAGLTIRH